MSTLSIVLVVIAGCAVCAVVVRFISRRHSTACPAWLIPLLENPYMNAVAGSQLLLDRAHVSEGMAVLDVGCGPGRIAIPAARRVGQHGRIVALDLQSRMLDVLRRRIAELGIRNMETVLAGAGEGKMPQRAFDRAFLVTVLGEIVNQRAALKEIFEALKPGGVLSVTEVLPDPHYQSRKRVSGLALAAGFEITEISGPWYAFTMNLQKPAGKGRRSQ